VVYFNIAVAVNGWRKQVKIKHFSKGQLICREDTVGGEMYVIISGRAQVYKMFDDHRIDLAYEDEGDFFGEISLLMNCPRTASIEAVEDTEVLVLSKTTFIDKIVSDPRFALKMATTMAKRLQEAHKVISRLEGERKSLEMLYQTK
jgi:CRP-like cAMP-binding protein